MEASEPVSYGLARLEADVAIRADIAVRAGIRCSQARDPTLKRLTVGEGPCKWRTQHTSGIPHLCFGAHRYAARRRSTARRARNTITVPDVTRAARSSVRSILFGGNKSICGSVDSSCLVTDSSCGTITSLSPACTCPHTPDNFPPSRSRHVRLLVLGIVPGLL